MFLENILMCLLLAFTIPVYAVNVKVYWDTNAGACNASDTYGTWGLRIDHHIIAFFDKKTRLIEKRQEVSQTHDRFSGHTTIEYNGDVRSVGLGVYSMVIRYGEQRSNENPSTNGRCKAASKIHGGSLTSPGTGIDCSLMYHEAPFAFSFEVYEEGNLLNSYKISKCAADNKWIGNEGYYKLNVETQELEAIYYDPRETDFYY